MGAPSLTTKQLACSPCLPPSPDCVISVMCTQERASLIRFTSFPEGEKGAHLDLAMRPRRKDCVPTKNEMNSARGGEDNLKIYLK